MTQPTLLYGVFALDWAQTELDGVAGLGPEWLRAGAVWRWRGQATRLDGSNSVLPLGRLPALPDLRPRARAIAARLTGQTLPASATPPLLPDAPSMGLVLTDGMQVFAGRMVQVAGRWLVVFDTALPPQQRDLYVVAADPALAHAKATQGAVQDVICFADDTLIATPDGPRPVDRIRAGDLVQTLDNGAQPVLWVGRTRISGVALRRFPHLRPIRMRGGALGGDIPTEDLRLSPGHRVVLRGLRAQALFNVPEVLVTARDLVDGRAIRQDLALHGVTYVHLLLEEHQVLLANGVACESFHPDMAAPDLLRPHMDELRGLLPMVGYGATARRCLNTGEAALLAA
jgi:hypothetical protein